MTLKTFVIAVVVNETVPSIPSNGLARSERPGTVQVYTVASQLINGANSNEMFSQL